MKHVRTSRSSSIAKTSEIARRPRQSDSDDASAREIRTTATLPVRAEARYTRCAPHVPYRRRNGLEFAWPELTELSSNLDQARRDAELSLVGAVLADHPRLLRFAADLGVRAWHFSFDDAKVVYLAAIMRWRRPLIDVLRLAQA